MSRLEAYDKSLPYTYALGLYPSLCLLEARPELATRLLLRDEDDQSPGLQKLRALARDASVREELAPKALNRISRKENIFAALVFTKKLRPLRPDTPHVVLVNPSDGGNLGTIIRTCVALGIEQLAIITPATDAFDPHVVRASMGAFFRINLMLYECFDDYLRDFPARPLYPFMLRGAAPIGTAARPEGAYSLIFGNEQTGLPDAFAAIGTPVFIPQSPNVDSLNLASAVAIGAYVFAGQTLPFPPDLC